MNMKISNNRLMMVGLFFVFMICTAEECEVSPAKEYKAEMLMLMSLEQQLDECEKRIRTGEDCNGEKENLAKFRRIRGVIPPPPPEPPCPEPANCDGIYNILKNLVYPPDMPVTVELKTPTGTLISRNSALQTKSVKFDNYNKTQLSLKDANYTGKAVLMIKDTKTGMNYPLNINIGQ